MKKDAASRAVGVRGRTRTTLWLAAVVADGLVNSHVGRCEDAASAPGPLARSGSVGDWGALEYRWDHGTGSIDQTRLVCVDDRASMRTLVIWFRCSGGGLADAFSGGRFGGGCGPCAVPECLDAEARAFRWKQTQPCAPRSVMCLLASSSCTSCGLSFCSPAVLECLGQ